MEDAHTKSIEDYNRIELDLANPNFFLPKLNIALQKKAEMKKLNKNDPRQTDINISDINRN